MILNYIFRRKKKKWLCEFEWWGWM